MLEKQDRKASKYSTINKRPCRKISNMNGIIFKVSEVQSSQAFYRNYSRHKQHFSYCMLILFTISKRVSSFTLFMPVKKSQTSSFIGSTSNRTNFLNGRKSQFGNETERIFDGYSASSLNTSYQDNEFQNTRNVKYSAYPSLESTIPSESILTDDVRVKQTVLLTASKDMKVQDLLKNESSMQSNTPSTEDRRLFSVEKVLSEELEQSSSWLVLIDNEKLKSIVPSTDPDNPTSNPSPSNGTTSQSRNISVFNATTNSSTPGLPSPSPSIVYSNHPSLFPSFEPSMESSTSPSITPSLVPSTLPSVLPSTIPSVMPSSIPSLFPSTNPTSTPSFSPSGTPSEIPSVEPSSEPSSYPSLRPSLRPSLTPSLTPSLMPSFAPSETPTSFPSSVPSLIPTALPTSVPSSMPTVVPSQSPTTYPSTEPSATPSAYPTTECHDVRYYRNPISGQGCEAHEGLDCTKSYHLGLNESQIEELILNCPVSCNIECETITKTPSKIPSMSPSVAPTIALKEFSTFLVFDLKSVPSMLINDSINAFEQVSLEYFSKIFDNDHPESFTKLKSAKLSSQSIIVQTLNRRLRDSSNGVTMSQNYDIKSLKRERNLDSLIDLLLNTTITGTTIFRNITSIQNILVSAAVNQEYIDALHEENQFFATASISASSMKINQLQGPRHKNSSKGSANKMAGTLLGTVATIALVASATGCYIFRYQRSKNNGAFLVRSPKTASNHPIQDNYVFSFEEGFVRSPNRSMASPNGLRSNGSSTTGSRSTFTDSNDESKKENKSIKSRKQTKNEIPPMIVIENIDCNDDYEEKGPDSPHKSKKDECNTPISNAGHTSQFVRHIEATPEVAALLSMKRQGTYEHRLVDLLPTLNTKLPDKIPEASDPSVDSKVVQAQSSTETESIRNLHSKSFDHNSISLSEGHLNDVDERTNNLNISEMKNSNSFRKPVLNLSEFNLDDTQSKTSSLKSTGINSPSKSIGRYSNNSYKRMSPSKVTRSASTGDVRREDYTISSDRIRRINKTFAGTESRESDQNETKENKVKQGNRNLTFSLPKRHLFKKDTPDAGDQSVVSGVTYSTNGACSVASTKVDIVAIPESHSQSVSPNHSRSSSSTSMQLNYHHRRLSGGTPHKYTFHAPSSGKLGIVIEASGMLGPTIHTVKDYSPLFGKVEKGDKLIEVDGESTVSMSTEQVTTLLAKKRQEKSGRGTIMIKVISATEKVEFSSDSALKSNNRSRVDRENIQRHEEKKKVGNINFKPNFSSVIASPTEPQHMRLKSYPHGKDFTDSHGADSASVKSKDESAATRQNSDLSSSDVNDTHTDEEKSLVSSNSTAFGGFHLMGGVGSDSDETSEDEEDDSIQYYEAL